MQCQSGFENEVLLHGERPPVLAIRKYFLTVNNPTLVSKNKCAGKQQEICRLNKQQRPLFHAMDRVL